MATLRRSRGLSPAATGRWWARGSHGGRLEAHTWRGKKQSEGWVGRTPPQALDQRNTGGTPFIWVCYLADGFIQNVHLALGCLEVRPRTGESNTNNLTHNRTSLQSHHSTGLSFTHSLIHMFIQASWDHFDFLRSHNVPLYRSTWL